MKTFQVLSIDAWRDGEGSWTWNNWYRLGDITINEDELSNARTVLKALRKADYLTPQSAGELAIEDDQHNITIMRKGTRQPILAIEYGSQT